MKTFKDSFSIGKGYGNIEVRKEGWTDGVVVTPHGIVTVYAQGDAQNLHTTSLRFAHKGRLQMITCNGKRYSPRGLITIAKRFAADCVNVKDHSPIGAVSASNPESNPAAPIG